MGVYDRSQERELLLDGRGLRLGIVMSRFNHTVCEGLLDHCLRTLQSLHVAEKAVRVIRVAGALEIPVVLKKLAESGKYDALIAIGTVIRGETYHFEVVSNEANSGITRVQLDTGVPVANAVLTVENEAQAEARIVEKGIDVARVAIEMAQLMKTL